MTGPIHLFRTYLASKHSSIDCRIWEAARATSAAPTFFEQIFIGPPGISEPYIDGGLGCNNPIKQVLEEARTQFPGRHVACIVSIGTGRPRVKGIPTPGFIQRLIPFAIVKALQGIATDCEQSTQGITQRFQSIPYFCFRFNVEHGLQDVGLADWKMLNKVTIHTGMYIEVPEVDQRLEVAATAICRKQRVVATAQISTPVTDIR